MFFISFPAITSSPKTHAGGWQALWGEHELLGILWRQCPLDKGAELYFLKEWEAFRIQVESHACPTILIMVCAACFLRTIIWLCLYSHDQALGKFKGINQHVNGTWRLHTYSLLVLHMHTHSLLAKEGTHKHAYNPRIQEVEAGRLGRSQLT